MTQKIYIVEGRQFRTEADYNRAMHDKELINKLRAQADTYSVERLRQLRRELKAGKYRFLTLLGQDFEEKEKDKIMAFDTLFTTNNIQMYKILLSYLNPAIQKKLAIYIKFMELQYTISFFQKHPNASLFGLPYEEKPDTSRLCDELLPLCNASQKDKIIQLRNMIQNLENMKEMMATIQMLQEMFPEGMGGDSSGTDMSQLFGMLGGGGDMSGMFDMFQMLQNSNTCENTDNNN